MVSKRSVSLMAIALFSVVAPSCAGGLGGSWQRSLSADPRLAENSAQLGDAPATGDCDDVILAQLPASFPAALCYPNAELVMVNVEELASSSLDAAGEEAAPEPAPSTAETPASEDDPSSDQLAAEAIATQWQTRDAIDQVQQYYQNLLDTSDWEIVVQTDEGAERELEAVKQGDRIIIRLNDTTLSAQPSADEANQQPPNVDEQDASQEQSPSEAPPQTEFVVEFRPEQQATADGASLTPDASRLFSQVDPDRSEAEFSPNSPSENQPLSTTSSRPSAVTFTDIDQAPEDLRVYIEDLAALGILSASGDEPNRSGETRANQSRTAFNPNAPIRRREYAQWLLMANNVFYGDRPSRKIRPAPSSTTPVFQDVSQSARGYDAIQGLAEAGLIPSTLSGESTATSFRPDASLTRETLIAWKVPLDRRGSLPTATVEAIKETWGFQDAASIAPIALQAVLADYQNGDNANILRAFGYTTLFQPQKAVTRAEAAAVLWHFGYQGDGISANTLRNNS